jgi:hypothetical protein
MEVTTKVSAKVTPESPSSQMPTVIVEGFLDAASGNTKGRNVKFRWVTEARQTPRTGLVGKLLGATMAVSTPQQRTAIQFMGNDVIANLKLEEGVNFNEAWVASGEQALRISISEITQPEYENLDAAHQIGYQPKINPSTGEMLTIKGEQIYLKRFLDTVDGRDEYLQHDGSAVKANSTDFEV